MQMWHLPAIFAPDFLLTFFGNSKFMQIHFFGSSHFRWYWRIYMLIPKKKASPSCGVKNVRNLPRILGQNNGNYDQKINGPLNSRTYTQSRPPTVVQGGGGWWNPPLGFLISCNISKRFCLHWKAFDILYKMRYILWVVALLEVCDVTKHGHRLGRHLGFYQELEMRWKQWELTISCA